MSTMKKRERDLPLPPLLRETEGAPRVESLADLHSAEALARCLLTGRRRLMECIREGSRSTAYPCSSGAPSGLATVHAFSDVMDAVIARMFTLAAERAGARAENLPIAVVATGGYGRRELCPFSDIDITFIPQRDGDPLIDQIIRDMFTQVMDVCIARCGLEVGYAYRLLEDCGSLDHQTASGLLDARLIAGSTRLFIQFEDAFWMGLNPAEFIFTKIDERKRALEKWGLLPRVVEPQLKEGPGGLRDLHTALWITQARAHRPAARMRGDRGIEALGDEAGVSADEVTALKAAREKLFQVRNALHAVTGAPRDELVITRQEEVAALLGDGGAPQSARSDEPPPVERFMADLYPVMALVRRVADQVMEKVGNSRLILGIGLDCKRKVIVPASSALESDDPVWMLWACELAQRYTLRLGDGLCRAAARLANMTPVLAEPARAAEVFTRILSRIGSVYPILQEMADLGILGWFLPEFGSVIDLIPYDPSHDHTVGQHSLLVVWRLEQLRVLEGPEELLEMRRILEELAHPEELMLAALLHDCGKADASRSHAEVSAEIARSVCVRLGWSERAAANVEFLTRCHLLMAETSRLRDLNLDETIRDFTRVVDEPDRLNMLYLLTYADTRAVGQGVWTQVRGRLLRELWRRSAAVLCEEEALDDDAAVARARHRLLKELSLENIPLEEITEHVQAMPPHYLLNQSLSQIALHIGFVRKVRAGLPVVDFHDERDATYTVLTVCAIDDPTPGLLAKITGALYAADLEVHSAQVLTRVTQRDCIALDTLWVDFRGRQLTPGKRREVAANLTAVLTGAQNLAQIRSKRRARRLESGEEPGDPAFAVRSVRNDLSDSLTVVEVGAQDAQRALFHACMAFARLGWDIRSARVDTWRGEARASFYLAGARTLPESTVREAISGVLDQKETPG